MNDSDYKALAKDATATEAFTYTVSDGKGGTSRASVRVGVFPEGCPSALDFDAIRALADAAAGASRAAAPPLVARAAIPYLTEPWYC